MKDYEMDELAARHLVGELVELPQFESERQVEYWFVERGFQGRMDLSGVEPAKKNPSEGSPTGLAAQW